MTTRPKRTKPDANQPAEHAKLTDCGCVCINVHDLPGNETSNPLDAFVMSPGGMWVQVEWKTRAGAKFTPNEKEYFKSLGIWDHVQLWLDPVALWRQTGLPVVVAWKAEQVVELLEAMEANAKAEARARRLMRNYADSAAFKRGV